MAKAKKTVKTGKTKAKGGSKLGSAKKASEGSTSKVGGGKKTLNNGGSVSRIGRG